ncbi:quinolinate synthase NadA [Tautonia rosea]|uniref:quinolinate synthase NadA n=1 Tax=Tautonia rosea TaxID=2728037 RepID=UPI001F37F614|nr:quinolinate synthase NadA [Tautonia rosea]
MPATSIDIYDEIEALKVEKDATILAHYYQDGEIQELADFTGDSLKLARAATTVDTGTIVFCGVHFMAETAKMLNPEKRVLLPDLQAGCSLADSCPAPLLKRRQDALRAAGRHFQTVTYINSSAAVKAISDWIVTSGNAEEIVRKIPEDVEILFAPDRHLGSYLEEVTGRKMILWEGACMVHEVFSVTDLLKIKRRKPEAKTIAHPECPVNIREHADYIGGTEAMIRFVEGFAEPTEFIVATEANMLWQLQHAVPRHTYLPAPGITCACNLCPHMARNTLEKLRDCLKTGEPEIQWQPEFERAGEVLRRSLLK